MVDVKATLGKIYRETRGIIFAIIAVLIIIGALFLYSGIWPPLVVVESGSMQHSDTVSYIGIIDTGDMVLVQRSTSFDGMRTYVSSYSSGYRSFGDFGDVIVYERYGDAQQTPVIHRAMVLLEYNTTSDAFDIPSLAEYPTARWAHDGVSDGRWWSLDGTLDLYNVGYMNTTVNIQLGELVKYHHGGLITKGDHNKVVDQNPMAAVCREPIMEDWVVGVARGELPWFGLLKLWVSGQFAPYASGVPANSWTDLFVSIFFIIAIPLALDVGTLLLKRRGIDAWARPRAFFERLKFWKKR